MDFTVYAAIILGGAALFFPLWADITGLLGHVRNNYHGRAIPQSMGAVFILLYLPAGIWAGLSGLIPGRMIFRFLIVVLGFGLLGLIDDICGDAKSKGFGGHLRRLLSGGGLSTGLVKAVLGFVISIWAVSGLSGYFLQTLWQAALVALSANFINLLDLRPGRALKGFFLWAAFLLWQIPRESEVLLLFPFLLMALACFSRDLAGEGMLGDAGANPLGGVLGLTVVYSGEAGIQIFCMAFLVFMHILAEKRSLSEIIAGNYFLRYLDNLGRTRF